MGHRTASTGVHKFLRRFWRMFFDRDGRPVVTDGEPTADELKVLHKTIKKVTEDIENFSFNTSVSAFMICQNELGALKCTKRARTGAAGGADRSVRSAHRRGDMGEARDTKIPFSTRVSRSTTSAA